MSARWAFNWANWECRWAYCLVFVVDIDIDPVEDEGLVDVEGSIEGRGKEV